MGTNRPRESAITRRVKAYLDGLGSDCWYIKVHVDGYVVRGTPDIIGSYKGLAFAVELKRDDKEQPTISQVLEIKRFTATGARGLVCWNIEQVKGLISELQRQIDDNHQNAERFADCAKDCARP